MHEWLQGARDRLASEGGGERADYELGRDEIDALLELARVAAHESGERTNAPLVCYLVGLARGRHGGALDDLVDAVVGKRV
ncbi:MAG: hypothetical protein ICV71_02695 [Thermoleophilia bacterium]|nr:hypothetical protein [Thermoleophilia bacterium]MDQ3858738.1 DUF6457 domain-containing protein [Actinomycetota bacterium]